MDKYQKLITKTLKHSDLIVNKKQKKYLTQKKPQPPDLRAQIKLHKPSQPIRPVVNNRNAPAYKISKLQNPLFLMFIGPCIILIVE